MKLKLFTTPKQIVACAPMILLTFFLYGCSDDDNGPDGRTPFYGTYAVEESDSPTESPDEFYEITISKAGESELSIDNFRFFFVPIKATISGKNLTIKSQTFTQGNKTLEVSGSGVLENNVLTYTYTLTGFANFTEYCVATKK